MPQLISADLPGNLTMVAAWGMRSSNGATKYEIVLWNTGHVSCDCPGWTFRRKDNLMKFGHDRWCKHLAEKWDEASRTYAEYAKSPSASRAWQMRTLNDDDEPDVIPRVKASRAKPVASAPVSLRPTRAFEV